MNLKSNESKELAIFLSIAILVVLAFSFALFGVTGIRVVIGIVFISFPFYLILANFGLSEGEKYVFSLLLGLTIFPSLVYMLGLAISFRTSIAVTFAIFVLVAIALWKYKKRT
ncbi:MAG: hypothetical protein Q8R04_06620 [Nanoarchaeota archaeon]|nr:hypothetical protein [Nanoarchaeota archaeon]